MGNKEMTLHTETFIDSCHRLKGYDGKCKNLHGHTWKLEVWVRGTHELLDEVGEFWVVTEPSKNSTLDDILFSTDVFGFVLQFKGGLRGEEILIVTPDFKKAEKIALDALDNY